ncbi:60S ribosomal protein L23A, partial [Chamberlinius hualienensis]
KKDQPAKKEQPAKKDQAAKKDQPPKKDQAKDGKKKDQAAAKGKAGAAAGASKLKPKPTPGQKAAAVKAGKGAPVKKDAKGKAVKSAKPGGKFEKKSSAGKGAQKKGASGAVKKAQAKLQAQKAKKNVLKGVQLTRKRKIFTSVQFHRPHTLRLPRSPKYPRKSIPKRNRMDQFTIIKHPLTTESAMKKIEDNNTLVFLVHLRANKFQIMSAVKKMYDIEVEKVNTLIRPDGEKKAYVRLASDYDALDVANKVGII